MDARLCLVVSPRLCAGDVVATVRAALEGGVDMVQLRDKEADDDAFLETARALAPLCRERGVPFVLNDRVHLVAAAAADGVHLGEDDLPPEEARAALDRGALIGLSTHDRAELAAARGRGADYAGLGPMYATGTKALARAPGGPALVRAVAGCMDLPWFPIGGITARTLPDLVAAGATRAAVSAAVCAAADPGAAAAGLRALLP